MMTEAEIGVMQLQTEDLQRLPATSGSWEEARKDFSLQSWERILSVVFATQFTILCYGSSRKLNHSLSPNPWQ